MKQFIYLIALVCAAGQLAAAAPSSDPSVNCTNFFEVLDDMGSAQAMTVLSDKYKLATNVEEWSKKCEHILDSIKTMRKYNSACQTQLSEQVLSAILRTRWNDLKDARCKEGTDKFKSVPEASKCIQETSYDKVKEAERKVILLFQVLADTNIDDDKLKLRRTCCNVIQAKETFLNATKEKCLKFQGDFIDYIDSYTSEAMGMICPDTSNLECDKLEPLKMEGVELKSTSFLPPMVKIVNSIDH